MHRIVQARQISMLLSTVMVLHEQSLSQPNFTLHDSSTLHNQRQCDHLMNLRAHLQDMYQHHRMEINNHPNLVMAVGTNKFKL
jgi:hypothetical protein